MLTKHLLRRAKLFVCVLFVTATTVCLIFAGEIADLHRKWVRPKEVDPAPLLARFERLDRPKHGVTEIGLERSACLGSCRVYTVILRSDGSVQYTGEENVPRKGKHTGKISDWAFNQLAEYLVESGYMEMESNYEVPLTDLPTAYTTAIVSGKRKIIRNYGDVGPSKLWALQQAIDGVLIEAEWDGDPKRPGDAPSNGKP